MLAGRRGRALRSTMALLCVVVLMAGCGDLGGLSDDLTQAGASGGSSSGDCADVLLLVARGTGEPGTLGFIVGDPLFAALQDQVGERASASPVDYPASADFSGGVRQGAADVVDQLTAQVEECPDQQFALAGYSQGAMVMVQALNDLPDDAAERVAAVVLFGNPVRALGTGDFADRTLDICANGDTICGSAGTGSGTGHLSYTGDVDEAAAFIAEAIGA